MTDITTEDVNLFSYTRRPISVESELAVALANHQFFRRGQFSLANWETVSSPAPVGLKRSSAAGYYFSLLQREQGKPAIRKNSPGVTESALEKAMLLWNCASTASFDEDVSSFIEENHLWYASN